MTAKGQLMLLGTPSTGLNLREKWQSGLSINKWAFFCEKLIGKWTKDLTSVEGENPLENFICS